MSGIVGNNTNRSSGLVKAAVVGADSITGSEIADDSIDSEHYVDGSIDNAHIADNAIDSEHYAAASIDNEHLADNAVNTAEIANNAVDETKLKDALVADFTEVVVTASDSILLGDATDSGNTKRDTVQGILDLAGGVDGIVSSADATAITIDASENVDVGGAGDPATVGNMVRIESAGRISAAKNGSNALSLYRQGSDAGATASFHYNTTPVGSISVTASATAFNTSSDYRLKTNIVPMTGATDRIKSLKPINFEWIADGTRVDGFLAHEVQAVVPECVTGTKDAMRDEEYEVTPAVMDGKTVVTEAVMGTRSVPDLQGIDQSKIVPLLVKTIQELESRITALEAV
jgi:hypothetical protein